MKRNAAIDIIGEDNCTGCYSCVATCPFSALVMHLNQNGFLKPMVTNDCINCGKCIKKCPVIVDDNTKSLKKTDKKGYIELYGGWSLDENIRLNSSSGGVFSEIAISIIESGGVVFGATWDNGVVVHKSITNIDELSLLRGSKYMQSRNLDIVYKEIVSCIKKNIKVLFVGTPCQVIAIKKIIESDLLYTIDLVCLGIPSYKVYLKHIQENFPHNNISKINFRSKVTGWKNFSLQYYDKEKIVKVVKHTEDPFYKLFNSKFLFQKSCVNCKFNVFPRVGDITLADFWGVDKKRDDPKGVSAIIVTSLKGKTIIDSLIKKKRVYFFKLEENEILRNNFRINSSILDLPEKNELFWKDLDTKTIKELEKEYLPKEKLYNRILRKAKRIIGNGKNIYKKN